MAHYRCGNNMPIASIGQTGDRFYYFGRKLEHCFREMIAHKFKAALNLGWVSSQLGQSTAYFLQ
jgi:hypothetical protein